MQNNSQNHRILLIITGSVAAYKSVDLIRKLQKKGCQVKVILTKSAQKFITKMLISSIAGKDNLYEDIFDEKDPMSHISLSRESDLILVAPATANFISKIANGICDDLASATVAASDKNIIVAPAMNKEMWSNDANMKNLNSIASNSKINLINPIEDILACQELGIGKMESCENITQKVVEYFQYQDKLSSYHIIVTGGGTREEIDNVRFIGNSSSGRQAIEIAHFARFCGAKVSFIAANIELPINIEKNHLYRVKSCDEMHLAVQKLIKNSDDIKKTIFISCAAVADFKPKTKSDAKIKKGSANEMGLKLVKNTDILNEVGNSNYRPKIVVGFAAEDGDLLIENAQKKLNNKKCDLIIANDIKNGAIFNSSHSEAFIISPNKVEKLGNVSKLIVAKKLIEKIINHL